MPDEQATKDQIAAKLASIQELQRKARRITGGTSPSIPKQYRAVRPLTPLEAKAIDASEKLRAWLAKHQKE